MAALSVIMSYSVNVSCVVVEQVHPANSLGYISTKGKRVFFLMTLNEFVVFSK